MKKDWLLDHIAHAVLNIDAGIEHYQKLLGSTLELRETLPEHQVEIAFLKTGTSRIELITPLAGNNSLKKFLEKRGESLHHIGFKVKDIEKELQELSAAGVKLIDEKPRKGAGGKLIAFLHPSSTKGVLVELCA